MKARTRPLSSSPRKNSSSMAGANTMVAMAITTKPPPWALPVRRVVGPLKSWMSCWNGAYMQHDEELPGQTDRDADEVDPLDPDAQVAEEMARPLEEAGQPGRADEADPQAEEVTTTYHSGGTEAVAMAWICAVVSPAMAPPMVAKMTAPIWPTRKPMTPKSNQNQA